MGSIHSRLTRFTNRLPRDYRPSMGAVGAAADAYEMLSAARPLHAARTALKAKQIYVSGIGRALAAMGDLSSDISGDVTSAAQLAKSAGSGDTSGAIAGGVGLAAGLIKTASDASQSGSSTSSKDVHGSTTCATGMLKIYDQCWDGTVASIPKIAASKDGRYTAKQLQDQARKYLASKNAPARTQTREQMKARVGQAAIAYMAVNGKWVPINGHWGAPDGVKFIPTQTLPVGAQIVVSQTGLPPSVDPSTVKYRVGATPSAGGAQSAAPAGTGSLPLLAVAAGGALLLARNLMGG